MSLFNQTSEDDAFAAGHAEAGRAQVRTALRENSRALRRLAADRTVTRDVENALRLIADNLDEISRGLP